MTVTEKPGERTEQAPSRLPPESRGTPTPQLVAGGVMILIGLLWLLERTGAVDFTVTAVLAIATMVVGISLMALARRGAHTGLIIFGTTLGLVALLTAAAPLEGFQGGVGDRLVEITTVSDIEPDYNLSMGKLTIDLTELADFQGEATLNASVGMGELIVRVPQNVGVEVAARSGAGEVEVFGQRVDGMGVDETYRSPGFEDMEDTLFLDIAVFLGRVEVTNE
ncbi:MAG: LiaF domain-containing protein [Acidimicrobiia bacterium]